MIKRALRDESQAIDHRGWMTRHPQRHRALAPVHYLLSRRNSSIASRIASSRSHFFLQSTV